MLNGGIRSRQVKGSLEVAVLQLGNGPHVVVQLEEGARMSTHNTGKKARVSRLLGVAYCWGVPRGIVFGFGEIGEGMDGGRFSTRGLLAE